MQCLNPYFFGKCSTASGPSVEINAFNKGLNPYFFGKCSTAAKNPRTGEMGTVLILIFLENALRPSKDVQKKNNVLVLILIFLENALRREFFNNSKESNRS